MEWLIGLALVAVFAFFALPALLGFGLFSAEKKGRAKAAANADQILDRLFDTDEPTVTYDTRAYNHLEPTAVIAGAKRRGWKLAHDDGGLLLLERD